MKKHLRTEMKARLADIPPQERAEKSYAACRALLDTAEFRAAESVMLYVPIPGEVDIAELALHAWQAGKTVLLPKVSWEQRHMIAIEIDSLETGLVKNRHGLREPSAGEPWPVERIGMIAVPGLAYDTRGHRLGRGGGFYDRFLSQPNLRAHTCGIAFSEQIVDRVPVRDHDHPVSMIATEKGITRSDGALTGARKPRAERIEDHTNG
ncbi:MAG: 5-formyltetrahydrofolate cyclo-ligase [Phycisphaerae bacterium]